MQLDDPILHKPSEALRGENLNYRGTKNNISNEQEDNSTDSSTKHDADSGNDGSSNEILQKEKLIDPGNEHTPHRKDAEESIDKRRAKHDAGAGGDGTGTMGSEPE